MPHKAQQRSMHEDMISFSISTTRTLEFLEAELHKIKDDLSSDTYNPELKDIDEINDLIKSAMSVNRSQMESLISLKDAFG